jgi:hypothetical protein
LNHEGIDVDEGYLHEVKREHADLSGTPQPIHRLLRATLRLATSMLALGQKLCPSKAVGRNLKRVFCSVVPQYPSTLAYGVFCEDQ